jgi:transposase
MPGPSARRIELGAEQQSALERITRRPSAEFRSVQRALVVLAAARGATNAEIARELDCSIPFARKWRSRWNGREESLEDATRSGRPARVTPAQRAQVVKLACDRPEKTLFRDIWTYKTLQQRLLGDEGILLSESEIGRILRASELRPHCMQLWLHSPDPEFRPKVERVCDLYLRPPAGATVLCVDEKTCIQALERKHRTKPAARGKKGRYEFEYIRHGVTNLFAAFEVRTGKVFGECRDRRKADDLLAFMEGVARRYPTGDVYIVWDNLNIHGGERWLQFNERHGGRFHFVFTPKHASWVNQVEIWFSILQRRLLTHGDFATHDALVTSVVGFIDVWNANEAHPFRWTFRGRFAQHPERSAA